MNRTQEARVIDRQPNKKESSRGNRENAAQAVRVVLIKDGVLLRPGNLASGRPR